MPGDITIGRSLHAKLGIEYLEDYSVRFSNSGMASYEGQELRLPQLKKRGRTTEPVSDIQVTSTAVEPEVVQFRKDLPPLGTAKALEAH
ncbi:hypothetical protein SEPCBS119000_003714, partial [Sporothrix epigloea]